MVTRIKRDLNIDITEEEINRRIDQIEALDIDADLRQFMLEAMAMYDDNWVTRYQLILDLTNELKETKIDNALKSLKSKNIIILDNANRGTYKLPTKSFATWIKIKGLDKKR